MSLTSSQAARRRATIVDDAFASILVTASLTTVIGCAVSAAAGLGFWALLLTPLVIPITAGYTVLAAVLMGAAETVRYRRHGRNGGTR